jgi:hypothetical protein
MDEREYLAERLRTAGTEQATANLHASRLSWARLVYLVVAVGVLAWLRVDSWWWVAVAAIPFAVLVRWHRRAERGAAVAQGAVAAARGAIARMDADWENMPRLQAIDTSGLPNTAAIRDLDLYGDRSLFRLVDVSQPAIGGVVLLRQLLADPDPLEIIRERQASVQALRHRPGYLLESARVCRHGSRPPISAARLFAFRSWCDQPATPFSPRLVLLARVVTSLFVALIIWMIATQTVTSDLARLAIVMLGLQLAIGAAARAHLRARLKDAADMLPDLADLRDVLRAMVTEPPVEGRFGAIQRQLTEAGAVPAFNRLARLFEWNGVQHSPMLDALMNALTAFDAHLTARVDAWREEHGRQLPMWIDLVAEAQAVTALATLGYENPGWAVPEVHDGESPFVAATDCGHPLIGGATRVGNPVDLPGPATAIVISGSNMSGKTTYLRATGLNVLLAQAGGPVCATAMTLRRCRVRTSVRIEDSLAANTSLFFAEVSRLRDVVVDAQHAGQVPVLFLFDEILHGTNAADRRDATRLVLDRLLASGASGMITTHDPTVGDVEVGRSQHAHFTDAIEGGQGGVTMSFDYIMRPGPATTTNALRILEAMGLRK